MTRNLDSPTARVRRPAMALAVALASVAFATTGVAGQEPFSQPEPVEPPVVEPTEIGPAPVGGQIDGAHDIAPILDLMSTLDSAYLREIAADWQLSSPDEGSAVADDLGCVDGPSRAIKIC